jgi:hypothetical protein
VFFVEDFLPYIEIFFDENVFCSIGFTARDCLHTIYCSIVADYIHNVRRSLTMDDVFKSMNCFSKYLIDQTITVHLHHMCCRILLNLLDCIKEKQDSEVYNARELTLKILEIIVTKFEAIAKTQMPYYMMETKKFVFSLYVLCFLFSFNLSSLQQPILQTASTTTDEMIIDTDWMIIDETEMNSNVIKQDRLDSFLNTPEETKEGINKLKFGPQPVNIQSDNDCRTTLKFLVYSSRTITMYLLETKISSSGILSLSLH